MNDRFKQLETLIEASEVSHNECAALITMLRQMKFYVDFKATGGDLFAMHLMEQITEETSNVA